MFSEIFIAEFLFMTVRQLSRTAIYTKNHCDLPVMARRGPIYLAE